MPTYALERPGGHRQHGETVRQRQMDRSTPGTGYTTRTWIRQRQDLPTRFTRQNSKPIQLIRGHWSGHRSTTVNEPTALDE